MLRWRTYESNRKNNREVDHENKQEQRGEAIKNRDREEHKGSERVRDEQGGEQGQ